MPEDIFAHLAQNLLKVQSFAQTSLFDKMKEALRDPRLRRPESEAVPEMLSVVQFKLMSDLYQFLPSKKAGSVLVPKIDLLMQKRRQSAMMNTMTNSPLG